MFRISEYADLLAQLQNLYVVSSNFWSPFFLACKKMKTPAVLSPLLYGLPPHEGMHFIRGFLAILHCISLSKATEISHSNTPKQRMIMKLHKEWIFLQRGNKNILNANSFSLVALLSWFVHLIPNKEPIRNPLWSMGISEFSLQRRNNIWRVRYVILMLESRKQIQDLCLVHRSRGAR